MSVRLVTRRVGTAALAAVATMALASCSSGGGDAAASGSTSTTASDTASASATTSSAAPTATVTVTTTAPATTEVTEPSTTAASSSSSAQAEALAVRACRSWKTGDTKSSAASSPDYDEAGRIATAAAKRSSRFDQLAKDMTFVSNLPLTGNTQSDVAKARKAVPRIAAACDKLGVSGISRD